MRASKQARSRQRPSNRPAAKPRREAQAFLEGILENIPAMVFVKDAKDLRFVLFNKAGEELLGYPRQELLGKNDFDFFPREEAEFFTRKDREILHAGTVLDIPLEPIQTRFKGRRLLHTKKVALRGPDGEPAYLLGISEDITELKERATALEQAVKDLESFAYSVSHDLRAPLRAIDGFVWLVLSDYGAALDKPGREALGRVRAAIGRMNDFIDALLAITHVGRQPLDIQTVDMTKAAQRAFELARRAAPGRRVGFNAQPGVTAKADPRLIDSVLDNLVGNAFKFTECRERGVIEFGTRRQGRERAYFVKDNGCGFDMADARQLFMPFQRLHSAADYPGTGIGLATVRRIIERHGGRIWAEASLDAGATFFFTLP